MSYDDRLKTEDEITDKNNLLKNVFLVEKYAEQRQCKTFHCFAQDNYSQHLQGVSNVLDTYTIKNCWPYWDKLEQREVHGEPNLASDGEHYGAEHHKRFAELFLERFRNKLK